MFEQLKQMAMQKLAAKMMSNSLGATETNQAAEAGSNALMDIIKGKMGAGGMDQVTDLFSNGGDSMENNGIFQEMKGKMSQILQEKGMSPEDAEAEATNATPDLINSMREKFESKDDADKAFDISNITNMLGGDAGGLMNKVKDLF